MFLNFSSFLPFLMFWISDSERITTSFENFYKKLMRSWVVRAVKYGFDWEAVRQTLRKSVIDLFRIDPFSKDSLCKDPWCCYFDLFFFYFPVYLPCFEEIYDFYLFVGLNEDFVNFFAYFKDLLLSFLLFFGGIFWLALNSSIWFELLALSLSNYFPRFLRCLNFFLFFVCLSFCLWAFLFLMNYSFVSL